MNDGFSFFAASQIDPTGIKPAAQSPQIPPEGGDAKPAAPILLFQQGLDDQHVLENPLMLPIKDSVAYRVFFLHSGAISSGTWIANLVDSIVTIETEASPISNGQLVLS